MIRAELEKWQEATDGLLNVLNRNGERNELIEDLVGLLAEREELKGALQGPFTPEEETLGKQLVRQETELTTMMEQLQSFIKGDLTRARKSKTNMSNYTDPYRNVVPDGTYYDQRK